MFWREEQGGGHGGTFSTACSSAGCRELVAERERSETGKEMQCMCVCLELSSKKRRKLVI